MGAWVKGRSPNRTGAADSMNIGDGVVRAERFLLILFVSYRVLHALDQTVVDIVLFDRHRSGTLALAFTGAWMIESAWLIRRAWRDGAYNQQSLVAIDVGFTCLLVLGAAWAGPPLTPTPTYAPGIAHTAALGLGAATRRVGVALAGSILLSTALVVGMALGARDSSEDALVLPLDAAIIPIALAVAAAVLARHVLGSGRDLDTAREAATRREAELSAQQERTRTARELHDKVLQTLETVARGSQIDDEALRTQAEREATRLRQLAKAVSDRHETPTFEPVDEPAGGVDRAERSLLLGYILFRVASLVFVLLGPFAAADVRSIPLAIVLAGACAIESLLILSIDRRRGFHGRDLARVDMLFTVVALVAGVWLLARPEAAPFAAIFGMGTMLGAGIAVGSGTDFVKGAGITSAAYLLSFMARFDTSALFEPFARDAVWFFGWGALAWLVARQLRNAGTEIDAATRRAIRSARATSAEEERARTAGWLATEVLPTLESLANAASDRSREIRTLAERASTWLQAFVQGRDPGFAASGLISALRETVRTHSGGGLTVDLNVAGMWGEADASIAGEYALSALSGAVGEALENVRKHAGVSQAVVRAFPESDGVVVTVVDEGAGFEERKPGFGISESIVRRLAEVGARATVESSPGTGTRVVIWIPAG